MELITITELCKLLKICRNAVYQLYKDPSFPCAIFMTDNEHSKKKLRWRKSDIEKWIENKIHH